MAAKYKSAHMCLRSLLKQLSRLEQARHTDEVAPNGERVIAAATQEYTEDIGSHFPSLPSAQKP